MPELEVIFAFSKVLFVYFIVFYSGFRSLFPGSMLLAIAVFQITLLDPHPAKVL